MTRRGVPRATDALVDLRAFLDVLRAEGDLVEVEAPVDPDLEIAEIHRRVIAAGGPALLFRRVKGHAWPVVTNLFGTERRVDLAFGPRPEALVRHLAEAPLRLIPPTPARLFAERGLLLGLLHAGRRVRRGGPVTEVVDHPPALGRLPLLRTWPEDGGAFITLPLVYTEHPAGLGPNLGMYRVQRFDDGRAGLHMQIHRGGGFHMAEYHAAGRPMPVNVHIGGPPVLILAAMAPLPENVPEILLASLFMGRRLPMARNPLGPLPVLAASEFCLVGDVAPGALHPEGPFGDHYGYYSLRHDYPLMTVRGLLRRRDPILAATVVGKPRQEDVFLGDYLQRLLAPFIRLAMPGVRDLWAYGEAGYHSLAAARVAERYAREAMVTAFRILGEGQLSLTKFLLATDGDVDLRDFPRTLEHVLARADMETDLFVFSNVSMDTLDYTGPAVNRGSKGVLVGLGPRRRDLPAAVSGDLPAGFPEARVFCPGCLAVSGPPFASEPAAAARLAGAESLRNWPLVALVDDAARTAGSPINFLWTVFTRFEPASDIHARASRIERNQAALSAPIVIDARMKPHYPRELFADPDTAALVTRRWREYFPSDVPMGDSALAHLG